MAKRLTTLILALALCLTLMPVQAFAIQTQRKAVIKEAPIPGVYAYNIDGLGLIEDEQDNRYLIDGSGGIYRETRNWMDFDTESNIYTVEFEGYYGYPNGETLFTQAQMEASVKAFLEENYAPGEIVSVQTEIMNGFSEGYAANKFSVAYRDGSDLIKEEFYALIDRGGLVKYVTLPTAYTSGGGFPITMSLDKSSEGLIRFTKEFTNREGGNELYEMGYMDCDGNEVLVFTNNSGRDPEDDSAIVIDAAGYSYLGNFNNGVAVITNAAGKDSLIDRSGRVLIPFEHDSIYNDCDTYPVVFDEGKGWGYIDTAGKTVIPQEYDFAKGAWGLIFVVEKGEKFGIVDENGQPIVPFEYDFMSDPYDGVVYACKGGKTYVITFEDAADDTLTPWGTKKVSAVFSDVEEGIWYQTKLQSAYDNGIIGGFDDGTFRPDSTLTHGQIQVLVANLHSLMKNDKYDFQGKRKAGFHWSQPYGDYCKAEGILDDRFDSKLDKEVTREEMAYYFAHTLYDDYYYGDKEFALSDIAGTQYQADIEKLAKADIVGGFSDGTFRPFDFVNRAQAAVFVSNILGAIGPTGGVY